VLGLAVTAAYGPLVFRMSLSPMFWTSIATDRPILQRIN